MALVSTLASSEASSPTAKLLDVPPNKSSSISHVSSALLSSQKGPVVSVVLEILGCANLSHNNHSNNNNNNNNKHQVDSHYVKIKLASSQKDVHKTKTAHGNNPRFTITQQSACCLHGMSLEQLDKENGLLLKVKNAHGKHDVGHATLSVMQLLEHCNSQAKTLELPLDDNAENSSITISIRPTTPQSVQFYQSRKWGLFYSFSPSKAGSINISLSHFDASASKASGGDDSASTHNAQSMSKNTSWRVSFFGKNKSAKKDTTTTTHFKIEEMSDTPINPTATTTEPTKNVSASSSIPAVVPIASVSDDDNSTIATQLTSPTTTPQSSPPRNTAETTNKEEENPTMKDSHDKDVEASETTTNKTPDHVMVTTTSSSENEKDDVHADNNREDPYHDDNLSQKKEECYHCFCMTPPPSFAGGECIIL